jgi:aminotransferase EvaB
MELSVIPLFDMTKHLRLNRTIIESAVTRVLNSSNLILGKEVQNFEEEFSKYLGIEHCVGVANGTDAIEVSLRALGANSRTRVGLVANAGGYARSAIDIVGAIPIYIECDPETMVMSMDSLLEILSTIEIDILIITHLYGQIYPGIIELSVLCEQKNILLIEDCAQANGATLNGIKCGNFGVLGTFSFYPTKNLGAIGDGGAIVCHDKDISNFCKSLRQYGWESKYKVEIKGGRNSRLDEIQAAVLADLLPKLDEWNELRRVVARRYLKEIVNVKIQLPVFNLSSYVGHLFPVYTSNPVELRKYLNLKGIDTSIHYPIHDYEQYAWLAGSQSDSNSNHKLPITIPISQYLDSNDIDQIISALNSF